MSNPQARPLATPGTRGVTILELMVVLVILGIVAGLAYVKFDSFQRQAELRSSAQKLYQILSWARLESEKRGDTLLVRLGGLPEIGVYLDQNANGEIDNGEPLVLIDSLARTVQVFSPSTGPTDTAKPSGGFAKGALNCGPSSICCDFDGTYQGVTSWKAPSPDKSSVAICARNMPRMPSDIEDGAVYLESSESKVQEKWTIRMAKNSSKNPTLWTSAKSPTLPADWSQKR
ncbi:MAG: prepilin-type N-terminal cleavage/methylation domain-containing protein [Fibrobacterota bacterium]|nr:prepilin-type N-terminal cleavage/methylation domain-containing protein [Fibrobacterota bacterium]QQS05069.1 MAG: prepilin-type N-terminal cleavage/methylation domain-containing protein [Fibrobacterota bacterium]